MFLWFFPFFQFQLPVLSQRQCYSVIACYLSQIAVRGHKQL
ncbi:hypothetical protein SLEP1_g58362 [Rubroshorea leprosula]|uniref:Uncharacterized protein n=1 Tax=Rubroshorea leprosula TaxID=152421 RepID=A0AAV5MQB9_9ROSI|nr:hypothetical protein SLEP1_g58362 [Rubroshorea leprosula]